MFGKIKSGHSTAQQSSKAQSSASVLSRSKPAKKASGTTKPLRPTKSSPKSSGQPSASYLANIQPNELQQDKIIAYFSNGRNINSIPADHIKLTPEQRQVVLSDLHSGKITSQDINTFLLQVLAPFQDPSTSLSQIFQSISRHPREKQILAVATGHNASNWQNFNEAELKYLLSKPAKGQPDFRTPVGFAGFRQQFIDGITSQATPEQLQEYESTMDTLEHQLYGLRFDYYMQIQLMASRPASSFATPPEESESSSLQAIIAEETSAKPSSVASSSATSSSALASATSTLTTAATAASALATSSLNMSSPSSSISPSSSSLSTSTAASSFSPLASDRANDILTRSLIQGSPWRQDGADYQLTAANLINSGLIPAYEISLDSQSLFFSSPFQLSDGRTAILGFIPSSAQYKVRSYYLDNKSGLWHFAPDIIRAPRGEGMSQITSGYSIFSTTLPIALQSALSGLTTASGVRTITNVNPDFLFAGTCAAYNTPQDYRTALQSGHMQSDFYQEVDSTPIFSSWQPTANHKNAPQLISINTELSPDFQQHLLRLNSSTEYVGPITSDSFPSHSQQYQWLFSRDDRGRSWVSFIEAISPLTSTGCRRDWVSAGDLATPLYVNSTIANGYGDPSDTRKGLVGTWNTYLSKIPLIQEYVTWRRSHN